MDTASLNALPTAKLLNLYRETFDPEFGPVPRSVFDETTREERKVLMVAALESGQPVPGWHQTESIGGSDPIFEKELAAWQASKRSA